MAAGSVGIDAMAFHGPECFVDMGELATARGVDPAKFTKGLGQIEMAVATPCEDTVSLATVAGRKSLADFDIDPQEIGTLIVGTETGVDHSKPVAVYVHELLGLPSNCRTFETKHACYGAMAGLTSAIDWIVAGGALIIASDIARYGVGTAGEPTQGAGAVAMVVSERPRLLAIDKEIFGDYTRQVMDFWRPLYSKYAFTDGHYSIDCYLDALSGAWADAAAKAGSSQRLALSGFDACFYHVPFVKMARKAHQRHWEVELGRGIARDDEEYAMKVTDSFEVLVNPWLTLNAVVGNIYTGSLFLALIDYLRTGQPEREGRAVSMFSYGSGCGAAFCFGAVAEGAAAHAAKLDPSAELEARRRLSVAEYEEILAACDTADTNDGEHLSPSKWQLRGDLFYIGTRNHIRQYYP
jgi:hydroxymethylglutaryl-CoA synthase